MNVATCKVAQVAAPRPRPGRFERLTTKAPGFAVGYLLVVYTISIYIDVIKLISVTETAQVGEILNEFEHLGLATSVICDRIAYRKATREGLSVAEMKPADPKAVDEMNAFRLEVFTDGKQAAQQAPHRERR